MDLVLVAAITGAHGVQGDCKVKSFTQDPEMVFSYGPFLDKSGQTLMTARSWRAVKDAWVVRFDRRLTREQAAELRGTQLFVSREVFPQLAEDEFYHSDLIGLQVQNLDGEPMGEVRAVHDFGSGDLLEIHKTPGQNGAWLIAFSREEVPHVSLADGVVTLDPKEMIGDKAEETRAARARSQPAGRSDTD